jgi:hypothetical protein
MKKIGKVLLSGAMIMLLIISLVATEIAVTTIEDKISDIQEIKGVEEQESKKQTGKQIEKEPIGTEYLVKGCWYSLIISGSEVEITDDVRNMNKRELETIDVKIETVSSKVRSHGIITKGLAGVMSGDNIEIYARIKNMTVVIPTKMIEIAEEVKSQGAEKVMFEYIWSSGVASPYNAWRSNDESSSWRIIVSPKGIFKYDKDLPISGVMSYDKNSDYASYYGGKLQYDDSGELQRVKSLPFVNYIRCWGFKIEL